MAERTDAPVRRPWRALVTLTSLALCLAAAPAPAAEPDGRGTYDDLVTLFAEFQAWREPPAVEGVVDYGPAALEKRRQALRAFQRRLEDMGVARWERARKVDYLLVRAHLDEQDFILHVSRPWARDPNFYVQQLLQVTFTPLPASGADLDRLRQRLRAVPVVVAQARRDLADPAGEYADLAIFNLTRADGVGHGHPYRAEPPAGVIGWYDDLLARATATQPDLVPEVTRAAAAVRDFHGWIVANRGGMTAENGVGQPAFDWFLRHVKLLPYTSDEIVLLAERELERLWGFYALERHRNRALPEIAISSSREDYEKRLAETDARIRRFLREEAFITVPDYVPADWRAMGFNVPWIARDTPPNFWEQVQFRDPTPDHLHAVIPGHRFDGHVEQRQPNPIRRASFGDRREGWAVYLEEAGLQAGLLDDLPRTRELIYVFGIWRAARTIGDVRNHRHEMTVPEIHAWWQQWTPWLDEFVARKYSYLQPSPGHGLHYTMGALQMWKLLGDRKQQLGEAFVLRDFHDEVMARGRIPVALLRYEMTGRDEDVKAFWERTPLSAVLGKGTPKGTVATWQP